MFNLSSSVLSRPDRLCPSLHWCRGFPALGKELGSPSSWALQGSCWPKPEVCEVPLEWSSATHVPSTSSYLVFSTNLVRVHLSYHPESIWRYWTISVRCLTLGYFDCYSVWLYPLITALWYGWPITAAFNSRFISLYWLNGVQSFLKLVFYSTTFMLLQCLPSHSFHLPPQLWDTPLGLSLTLPILGSLPHCLQLRDHCLFLWFVIVFPGRRWAW